MTTVQVTSDGQAIVYGAKSTTDPHGSIETQLADGEALAARDGLEVVGKYSDEARSAYHGNRGDGLAQAMAHAERIAPCALIVQHSDRLARGDGKQALHVLQYVFWAMDHGVTILSVQDPRTFEDLVNAAVSGSRNFEDSRRKSLAVAAGMKRRAAKGLHHGGPRPYGYSYVGPKLETVLTPVPGEAEVVESMFGDFLSGVSQRAIARALNDRGIPASRGRWHQASIAQLLRNPIYAGLRRHNGEIYPATHEPIVPVDLFEDVQKRLDRQSRRGGDRGRPAKGSHLLTKGLLRCGRCGEAMVPVTKPTRTGTTNEVYCCWKRMHDGATACATPRIPRVEIDEALLREITTKYVDLAATRQRLAAQMDADVRIVEDMARQADRAVAEVEAKIAKVETDYFDGELQAATFERFSARLADDLAAKRAAADQARAHAETAAQVPRDADAEAVLLRQLAKMRAAIVEGVGMAPNLEALRRMLRDLFEEIVFHPADAPAPWYVEQGGYEDQMPKTASGLLAPITSADRLDPDGLPLLPLAEIAGVGLTT